MKRLGEHWALSRSRSARKVTKNTGQIVNNGNGYCPMPSFKLIRTLNEYFGKLTALLNDRKNITSGQNPSEILWPYLVLDNFNITYSELYHYIDIITDVASSYSGTAPCLKLEFLHFPAYTDDEGSGYCGAHVLATLISTCKALHIRRCVFPNVEKTAGGALESLRARMEARSTTTSQNDNQMLEDQNLLDDFDANVGTSEAASCERDQYEATKVDEVQLLNSAIDNDAVEPALTVTKMTEFIVQSTDLSSDGDKTTISPSVIALISEIAVSIVHEMLKCSLPSTKCRIELYYCNSFPRLSRRLLLKRDSASDNAYDVYKAVVRDKIMAEIDRMWHKSITDSDKYKIQVNDEKRRQLMSQILFIY